ncbi:tRNA 2'-phosphotransferase 1 [Eumeta japonica]|uniref:2'-phosphotransferase n=1 Tax=Eumeta variegata TaxID=151549 RepID=A0A4C1SKG9_EUMVA|nr:tRNA 2'-phosphotransferase 1 [Eumeta japonica]
MLKKEKKILVDLTTLSKKLSWLLRHGAVTKGLQIQENGFINVQDILQHPNYKDCFNLVLLKTLVETDRKQRYTLRHRGEKEGYEIRANQGHTLKEVKEEMCLKRIMSANEVPLAVHGTYFRHWSAIKSEGLKRMSRNHVHFATSIDKADNISGFRSDCQILIYLDVKKALESKELKLYRSDNNIVLCSGLEDGSIPMKYFKKVVERRTGKCIPF